MVKIKIRYLVAKKQKGHVLYYWQPTKELQAEGFLTRRLSDGRNDEMEAIQEAQGLNVELDAWRAGKVEDISLKPGTVKWLIDQYQKDSYFLNLRVATKEGYLKDLKYIEAWAADISFEKINRVAVRAFLDSFKDKTRTQKKVCAIGRVIYNFARNLGLTKENPFDGHRIKNNPPRQQIWLPEEETLFVDKARELKQYSMALGEILLGETGQRETDVIKLAWSQYDGLSIKLTQSKTGAVVTVPVTQRLKIALDAAPRFSTQMVVNETTKKPYNAIHFSQKFRKVSDSAGISRDKQLRDLRRTAVVNLARAGCTVPEIASITGHAIDETSRIIETYLPRDNKLAESAIYKLEKYRKKSSNSEKGA